ncbi:hypothetical protein AB833_08495 [Chromatiales bacterium (ex Bugula neritina AB1)]|nr:hypothetical protein AB833_08495 [Chromatiales bacterium (ex Bugula neritina AB1)]
MAIVPIIGMVKLSVTNLSGPRLTINREDNSWNTLPTEHGCLLRRTIQAGLHKSAHLPNHTDSPCQANANNSARHIPGNLTERPKNEFEQ